MIRVRYAFGAGLTTCGALSEFHIANTVIPPAHGGGENITTWLVMAGAIERSSIPERRNIPGNDTDSAKSEIRVSYWALSAAVWMHYMLQYHH